MELVFASSNQHKISEISAMLPAGFILKGLKEIGIVEDIPETGSTIAENSFLKAKYVRDHLHNNSLAVFADDSGLEVQALDAAPGVYSARYAGVPKNDFANNEKLLREMQDKTDRRARFVTVITLLLGNEKHVFEGSINGTIAHVPRGNMGFGYDPLFIPQGLRSTFAELTAEQKNAMSHRAKAVGQLVEFLKNKTT